MFNCDARFSLPMTRKHSASSPINKALFVTSNDRSIRQNKYFHSANSMNWSIAVNTKTVRE